MAGRLSEDEFEARVGQAFASRTTRPGRDHRRHPGLQVAAQAARLPDRAVAWSTGVIIAAAALGGALLIGVSRVDPLGDHNDRGLAVHRERAAQRAAGTTIPQAAAGLGQRRVVGPRRRAYRADRP